MFARIVRWAGAVLAAASLAAGAPLLAQPDAEDAPIPRSYPPRDSEYAHPGGDPARIAREKQAADASAAQCESGAAPAACTALGIAYRRGEGRPQSRPVAELIFREACAAGEPSACAELGDLLRFAAGENDTPPHARFIARACTLGLLSACTDHARLVEAGVAGPADPAAADAIRDRACTGGESSACLALIRSLIGAGRTADERARGLALMERRCDAGDRGACAAGAQLYGEGGSDEDPARARGFRERGCTAGDVWACGQLAQAALKARGETDAGDATAAALRYLDLACPGLPSACTDAASLRAHPALERDCAAGLRAACLGLAAAYREWGGVYENPDKAQAMLTRLCQTATDAAQRRESCGPAGTVILGKTGTRDADELRQAEAMLTLGCDAGDGPTCLVLARALAEDSGLPQDLPRSYDLFAAQCTSGANAACDWLARNIASDPATPLLVADGDFGEAEAEAQVDPAAERCTDTRVTYRGTAYDDTICSTVTGVINGTPVKAGTAPWQALIWRPERIGNAVVAEGYNVLCGGSVIRTGWILTAAHCLTDQGRDIAAAGHRIRLGVNNPLSPGEGHSYPILRTHKPPQYVGPPWLQFDIALIEYDPRQGERGGLAQEVRRIAMDPQPFAARPIAAGTAARVYGWGSTTVEGSGAPSVLLQGKVALRTAQACDAAADFTRSAQLRGSLLCGDAVGGQQACSGDSGGPVIVFEPVAPGGKAIPVLIGVVSSGVECGTRGKPSRYTRLAHPVVQKWLARVLPPASSPPRPQAR